MDHLPGQYLFLSLGTDAVALGCLDNPAEDKLTRRNADKHRAQELPYPYHYGYGVDHLDEYDPNILASPTSGSVLQAVEPFQQPEQPRLRSSLPTPHNSIPTTIDNHDSYGIADGLAPEPPWFVSPGSSNHATEVPGVSASLELNDSAANDMSIRQDNSEANQAEKSDHEIASPDFDSDDSDYRDPARRRPRYRRSGGKTPANPPQPIKTEPKTQRSFRVKKSTPVKRKLPTIPKEKKRISKCIYCIATKKPCPTDPEGIRVYPCANCISAGPIAEECCLRDSWSKDFIRQHDHKVQIKASRRVPEAEKAAHDNDEVWW